MLKKLLKLALVAKTLRRDNRGVAAVEFAILSPIIIIMIIGVLESGRLLYTRSAMQSGLEMAGRYAMVHPSASQSTLQEIAFGDLDVYDAGGAAPTLTKNSQGGSDADFIVLQAKIDHKLLIPFIDRSSVSLSAQTVVPIESP